MTPKSSLRALGAVAALAFLAACQDSSTSAVAAPDLDRADNRSPQAQERLALLFPDASAEVLDLPGSVYADHNESTGKLEFGVERAEQARGVEARLRARGMRDGEFEIKVTEPITMMATLQDDTSNPTRAGTQIHFGGYVCTLGINISTTSFVTNSHCTNTQGGVEGTLYHMPIRTTGAPEEAIEVEDPGYQRNLPGCSKGKKCRRSDASRAEYRNGTTGMVGTIASAVSMNTGSLTIGAQNFSISTVDNTTDRWANGTAIQKVGRTTGWTGGTVSNSCVNINVSGTSFQQLCQTLVTNNNEVIVSGGDSGSPVFINNNNGTVKLVGLLWGGSGTSMFVFSPIRNVQAELSGY